jgi:hypothetical protein
MKPDRMEEGRVSDHGEGLGTVTRAMVMKRAREIAVINGRSAHNVLDSDIDEARQELEGKDEINPQPTAEESFSEDKRWDPCPPPTSKPTPKKFMMKASPTRNTTRKSKPRARPGEKTGNREANSFPPPTRSTGKSNAQSQQEY